MHEIEIPHASISESFERRSCDTLEDPCPEHAFIALAVVCSSPPGTTCDQDETPEKEQMSLSPYPGRSHKQKPSNAHPAELIPGEKRRICERSSEVDRECHAVGRKEWACRLC